MAARWRILLRTINLIPQNVDYVVKAACVLNNYLLEYHEYPEGYADGDDCFVNTTEGSWRAETSEASKSRHFLATSQMRLGQLEKYTPTTSLVHQGRLSGSGSCLV
ncbi:unnamed protein product [Ixodes persulcatus]